MVTIPQKLIQGESAVWKDDPTTDSLGAAVTSASWTLTYALRGPVVLDLVAVADGSGWKTTLSVTDSATLTPGTYYWQAILTKGSPTVTDRILFNSGRTVVEASLASVVTTNFDGRSQAQKDLEAVQAAIRSIISGGAVKSYTIGNRSLTKMDMADLLMLESKLKADVARERKAESMANGLGNPHNLFVRFK